MRGGNEAVTCITFHILGVKSQKNMNLEGNAFDTCTTICKLKSIYFIEQNNQILPFIFGRAEWEVKEKEEREVDVGVGG